MLLILEVVMFVMGILAIVRGKLTLSKKKVCVGVPARVAGAILVLPIPVVFGFATIYAIMVVKPGMTAEQIQKAMGFLPSAVEIGAIIVCGAVASTIASMKGQPAESLPEA